MRATSTLFRLLSEFLLSLPKRVRRTVLPMIEAIWEGQTLTLTGIARHLRGRARVKHKIKQVYRLLAHPEVHLRFDELFAAIAAMLIVSGSRPVLLVDWTCFDNKHYALVASIVHDGRSIPVYVEVHPISEYATEDVETAFLHTLKHKVLPKGCRPVVVSDAGFKNPWFATVQRLGWDFVGRLCGRVYVQPGDARADLWVQRAVVMEHATQIPLELGLHRIAKTNPLTARLVTVHYDAPRMPSQTRKPCKRKDSNAKKYRRLAEEPWLLVTSLAETECQAAAIVTIYAQRMQIEETFRDDKNRDTGVGLDASRSQKPAHLRALRWLGALTSILTHPVGLAGEMLGIHRHYQSNTVTDRRVLSLPFLGRQMLRHEDRRRLTMKRLRAALDEIRAAADLSRFTRKPEACLSSR